MSFSPQSGKKKKRCLPSTSGPVHSTLVLVDVDTDVDLLSSNRSAAAAYTYFSKYMDNWILNAFIIVCQSKLLFILSGD